jgi:predicted ATPase/DNA-binding CsgD family transcriptional regulator/tetratricopeptide (TPR) repeat protein
MEYLSNRNMLLVLDNCEHVTERAATLVAAIMATAPSMYILATSRESLRGAGERVIPVPPLSVPDPNLTLDAYQVRQFDSVKLLVDRTTAFTPEFTVNQDNYLPVAQLCAGLEGSPLAIELAASRLRTLSVAQVVERLADQFNVFRRGDRSAPSRQQSLRALVDWSFELCSAPERLVWQRAAVFVGGFDLDAAESVCGRDGVESGEVLDLLDQLVAKSIIVADTGADRARYRFLETIRQYGLERLKNSDEVAVVFRSFRDHYLNIAGVIQKNWASESQVAGIACLREERLNLARSLEWSFTTAGEERVGMEMVNTLRFHWAVGGFLREGRRWVGLALDANPDRIPERGTTLWVGSWIALVQGEKDAAEGYLTEATDIAGQFHDDALEVYVSLMRGTAALFSSDLSQAIELLKHAVQELTTRGDYAAVLLGSMELVVALAQAGDSDEAKRVGKMALELSERLGEQWGRCQALWALGFDSWLKGDYEEATSLVRLALTMKPEFNRVGTALDLELLAWIAWSKHEVDRAIRILGAARALWTDLGTTIDALGVHFGQHSAKCDGELHASVRDKRYQQLSAEGRSWDVPQAVAYALATGDPPRARATAEGKPIVALTRRERQIAEMLAEGMSNREIAESLVLSPRTVDGHVENILMKLNFKSRAAVASWVTRSKTTENR